MARVKRGVTTHKRHKKVLKRAKGFVGRSKNCFRIATEKVDKALQYAYRDRRNRKREFRSLWIARINAAVRAHGVRYSDFISRVYSICNGMNRKMLSEIAIRNPEVFAHFVDQVKANMVAAAWCSVWMSWKK